MPAGGRHVPSNHPTVPGRPRRQPAAPAALLRAREDHAAGRLDADELRAGEDEAIREVVRMQEEVGLQSATDGEFRRASWHMDFIYQLGGIRKADEQLKVAVPQRARATLEFAAGRAAGRRPDPARPEPIFGDDFAVPARP